MDKKMKRVVGYVKPLGDKPNILEKATPFIKEATVTQLKISEIVNGELLKVKKIVKWIKDHPEFKWGVMCKKLGMDKGNFQRTLNSDEPKIKIEYIPQIIDFLKNYGYAE